MRILFIDMYAVLGGVPIVLINRFKSLKNICECHFAFLYDYGGTSLFEDYQHVYILDSKQKFLSLLNQYDYDVISVIDSNIIYDWLSDIKFRGLIINEVHTTYPKSLEKLANLRKKPPMDLIMTPSEYMKNIIEKDYKFKDIVPVEVVVNCLDLEKFNPKNYKKNFMNYKILWVGRLDEHKRYGDFLEICRKLQFEYSQIEFEYIIVGGINSKQEVIDEVIEKAIKYGILENLKWYSSIEYNEMNSIYSQVKLSGGVYISTTSNESFGMSVLESMAARLPVVIPNVGALPELIPQQKYEHSIYNLGNFQKACELIVFNLNSEPYYDLNKYSTDNYAKAFKKIISNHIGVNLF